MRIIVRALLPLGVGTIFDPFMGSGSTIAAAQAVGYTATGLELDTEYFRLAEKAIPRLAELYPDFNGQELQMDAICRTGQEQETNQLALVLADHRVRYKVSRRKANPAPLVKKQ